MSSSFVFKNSASEKSKYNFIVDSTCHCGNLLNLNIVFVTEHLLLSKCHFSNAC